MKSVLDYGADPTGKNDSRAAFLAAINDASDTAINDAVSHATGITTGRVANTVHVPAGAYLIEGALTLTRPVRLVGEFTSGRQTNTVLLFDNGGIELLHDNETAGAQGTTIENLYLISKQHRAGNTLGNMYDGLLSEVTCQIKNVTVVGFGGNGIHLNGSDLGDVHRNCCQSRVEYCWLEDNAQNGIYVHGGSANSITFLGCMLISNLKSGIRENAFLGNCHLGHSAENNREWSYEHEGSANWSLFAGCYAEGDNHAQAGQGSIFIGGCVVVDRLPELGFPLHIQDALHHGGFNTKNKHLADWSGMEASWCLNPNRIIEWQARNMDDFEHQLVRGDDGWFHFTSAGTTSRSVLAFQADNKQNLPPDVWAKRGMRLGPGGARVSSGPVKPDWVGHEGDVYLNTAPVSGGHVGWVWDGTDWLCFGPIS